MILFFSIFSFFGACKAVVAAVVAVALLAEMQIFDYFFISFGSKSNFLTAAPFLSSGY